MDELNEMMKEQMKKIEITIQDNITLQSVVVTITIELDGRI